MVLIFQIQTEDFESRVSEAVTRCLISPLVGARDELSDEETESDSWINPGEVNKFFISFNIGGKCVMCRNTLFMKLLLEVAFVD